MLWQPNANFVAAAPNQLLYFSRATCTCWCGADESEDRCRLRENWFQMPYNVGPCIGRLLTMDRLFIAHCDVSPLVHATSDAINEVQNHIQTLMSHCVDIIQMQCVGIMHTAHENRFQVLFCRIASRGISSALSLRSPIRVVDPPQRF